MSKAKPLTKYESLHYLLGQYGDDRMTREEFWRQMNARGYTQADIDGWCEQYHELEAKREQDDEERRRKKAEGWSSRTATAGYARGPSRSEQEADRQEREADWRGAGQQGEGQGEGEAWPEGEAGGGKGQAREVGTMIVMLSPKWMAKAIQVGRDRNAYAAGRGYQNYGELMGSKLDHDITGAIAECSVAKFFGLRWDPSVGVITNIDVGERLEVRGRRISQTGGDLPIRPDDKDDKPYVLCWVYDDNSVDLRGWLFAKEAKGRGQWRQNMGVWFVGPPYRPIPELQELLAERMDAAFNAE